MSSDLACSAFTPEAFFLFCLPATSLTPRFWLSPHASLASPCLLLLLPSLPLLSLFLSTTVVMQNVWEAMSAKKNITVYHNLTCEPGGHRWSHPPPSLEHTHRWQWTEPRFFFFAAVCVTHHQPRLLISVEDTNLIPILISAGAYCPLFFYGSLVPPLCCGDPVMNVSCLRWRFTYFCTHQLLL